MRNDTYSPQAVFQIFQRKYPVLKKVKLTQIDAVTVQKYHGYAKFTLDEQILFKGKTRQRKVNPYQILLNKNLQQNIYVLLHEIAHCLAPHVERRYKDEWVYLEHERQFYEQLFEIVRIANKERIYEKKFKSVDELMKYDKTV